MNKSTAETDRFSPPLSHQIWTYSMFRQLRKPLSLTFFLAARDLYSLKCELKPVQGLPLT